MVSDLPRGGARAVARCDMLGIAPYSDIEDGLFRAYLTPAFHAAQLALSDWMTAAGMRVHRDAAANLIGRYEGIDPDAPALLIGSHLDSVRDAGRYDGPLGIMLGIEAVAALDAAGRRLPFAIEIIAFGDEEGSRFPAAMLTSRAFVGTLDRAALDITDGAGIALADAGIDVERYLSAARSPASVFAYLEAHIEQGPVLEAEGLAVGVVTGIAAQLRYQVSVTGRAGHAGTTTMSLRCDALAAAAEMVLAIERIACADNSDLVATVGRLMVQPGAPNVIPGSVTFSLDVRALDAGHRTRKVEAILAEIAAISDKRGTAVAIEPLNDLSASPCDPELVKLLDSAVAEQGITPFRLPSGAGHDAMVMAALCPTAMLFIRCRAGISHNPAEHVDPADAGIALDVMLGFIDQLGNRFDDA